MADQPSVRICVCLDCGELSVPSVGGRCRICALIEHQKFYDYMKETLNKNTLNHQAKCPFCGEEYGHSCVGSGYRLLVEGEAILPGDEFLSWDDAEWLPETRGKGRTFSRNGMRPMRRKVTPPTTQPNGQPADPGNGYRLLNPGEVIQHGDEWFKDGKWRLSNTVHCEVGTHDWTYRRKIGQSQGRAVDPGPGWRLLLKGETIKAGDEFFATYRKRWEKYHALIGTPSSGVGCARRKIDSHPVNGASAQATAYSTDRKSFPMVTGLLDYFPDALALVSKLSKAGNDQHHGKGAPLHWDRSKSPDEADALLRHLSERGTCDTDGVLHSAKVAWRALALLQKELERDHGFPMSRASKNGGGQ